MLKNLVFYQLGSLGDVDAKIYYDIILPLFWDKDRKCIVMDLSLSVRADLKLKFYHDKGLMRFNDPGRIEEFIDLYGGGPCDIYEEFSKNWGDWDFSTIVEFGSSEAAYVSYYGQMLGYYPEFLLDTGDHIEENMGFELQDGMGIMPYISILNISRDIRDLMGAFLIREKYLKCEEVLLSREYANWVEERSLEFLKNYYKDYFDVSTLRLSGSEITSRKKFQGELDKIEFYIHQNAESAHLYFENNICRDVGYFKYTFFKLDMSEANINYNIFNKELAHMLEKLSSYLYKEFYGPRHAQSLIEFAYLPLSLTFVESDGLQSTLRLRTTVGFH